MMMILNFHIKVVSTYPAKEYFSLKFTHENVSPEKYYLPFKIENISLRSILKIMIKKIFN